MTSLPHSVASLPGAVQLAGSDALDLVHRISTQKLDDLAVGAGRATMICDFRGRLLHRAWVARTPDSVWLLRPDAPGAELAAFLDRHLFREDVRIEPRDGDAAAPALPDVERFASEADRIRAGHPRHGHEIAEEFTPFEIGRAHEVHLSKGCFTGQEALMRLVTYRSVRRRLALVAGEGAPPAVPADVTRGEQRVGRLTSAVEDGGGWIGLAALTHDAAEPGAALVSGGAPFASVTPFPLTHPLGLPEASS
jgi:folate-binding protein YgfZ